MKLVREHINEKFEEESDPVKDMGIGAEYDIVLMDNFKPFLDEYHRKYNPYYNDPLKDQMNLTGMRKGFEEFKKEIEPFIIGRFIEGRMWQVNKGWVTKKIKVVKIKNAGLKSLFHPHALQFFHVIGLYYNSISLMESEFAIYLIRPYHVTLKF